MQRSDGYRFGGERICSNAQVQGNTLRGPKFQALMEPQDRCLNGTLLDNLEALRSQKTKLEHAVEKLNRAGFHRSSD